MRHTLLLIFGLYCLVSAFPTEGGIKLYGNSFFNPNADMSGQLDELKKREEIMQKELQTDVKWSERWTLEMNLQDVQAQIAQMEATLKVSYKDYLQSLSGERGKFEKAKEELRKKLANAENLRLQALEALQTKEHEGAKLASLQEELQDLTVTRNELANEYANLTEAFHKQEQEREQQQIEFENEQSKMQQTLQEANDKHSDVLVAMSAAAADGFEPIRVPEQDTINELKANFRKFRSTKDRKDLLNGLIETKTQLELLLQKLYVDGRFTPATAREDMEGALSVMELHTFDTRQEFHKRRRELLENLKRKDLANYNDEEIASLQQTNEAVAATDVFQNELARRNACLKGISQVSDLLKECSEAIRDANERNLANMWANAIEQAKDLNLAKLWTDAIQDVKDSELAKVWADAIQDVKDSPLAQMWLNKLNNAKDSPIARYCANTIQDAKNTLCRLLTSHA